MRRPGTRRSKRAEPGGGTWPAAFLFVFCLMLLPRAASAVVIGDHCTATVLNRTTLVADNGTFALGNVTIPIGAFRARVFCDADRTGDVPEDAVPYVAESIFVTGVANGETQFEGASPYNV